MKKIRFILCALAALAFASCQQVSIQENTEQNEETPAINYVFNITVANPDGADTKSVKTGWEEGDVIGLWMDNAEDCPAQVSLTFDGQNWACTTTPGVILNNSEGHLSALYKGDNDLDLSSSIVPLVLSCEGVEYTTSETNPGSIEVTATLNDWVYETPIQIVVPGIEDNFGDYTLSCEDLVAGDGIIYSIDSNNNYAQFSIANAALGNATTGVYNENTSTNANNNGGAAFYFTESNASSAQAFTFVLSYNGKSYTYTSKPTTIYADGTTVKRVNKKLPEFIIDETGEPVSGCKWSLVGDDSVNGFVKVTAAPADWSGEYLLVYEVNQTTGRCWTGVDAANCYEVATIENGVISTKPEGAVTVTIASMTGGYSIKVIGGAKDGNFISGKNNTNSIQYGGEAVPNDITISNGAVTILSNSTSLRYNSSSGQDRFRYFKTTTTGATYTYPALYKLVGEPAPAKTLTSIAVSGTPTKTDYYVGDAFDPAGLVVTATYDDNSTANVTESAEWTITPSELAVETTSVSVTAKVGEVTSEAYVINGITVNAIPSLTTIDQIFKAATAAGKTATDTRITFNEWVVSGIKQNESSANVYVTDGTKGFIVYGAATGFAVGDIISGTADCKVQLYNGAAELTALTSSTEGITVTEGGTITPVQTTIANLSGVNTGAVIDLGQLTYNGTQFTDGENIITPYNTFMSLPTFTSGKKYNVSGIFIIYNTTKEIAPRDANDITEVPAEKYGITINVNNTAYGSVTTNAVDNQAVEGQEVALTVSPAEGYKLASLTVVDSDDQSVDVNNNKFTMPAKAVTVSATFVEKTYYNIAVGTITNGTVTPSKTRAEAGETITVTVEPEEGYKLATLTYNGVDIAADKSFVMPAENVTIAATFEVKTGSEILTTTLTNANIVAWGTGDTGYKTWSGYDGNGLKYTAYAIKNQHSNATSAYHYLQIRKYASGTAYYIKLPDFPGKIKTITMTVSSPSKPMADGGNTATLYFSNSNSTAATGTGVASGTGASSVTIDANSLDLKSGYITASGAVRIWDITVEYYSE